MENRYDYQAHKSDAILIPCCGFDSVPADVVVYLANKTAKSALGPHAYIEDSISLYKLKGGMSGGTIASAISAIEDVPKAITAEAMKDFSYREREGAYHSFWSPNLPANSLHSKRASYKTYEVDIQCSCRWKNLVWCIVPHVSYQSARGSPLLVILCEVPGSISR